MTNQTFSDQQAAVVQAIMAAGPNAPAAEGTAERIAARAGLTVEDTRLVLRGLEDDFDSPVVHRDVEATTGEVFWVALVEADEILNPPEIS